MIGKFRIGATVAAICLTLGILALPVIANAAPVAGPAQSAPISISFAVAPPLQGATTSVSVAGMTSGGEYVLSSDHLIVSQPSAIASAGGAHTWEATVSPDARPATTITVWVTSAANPDVRLAEATTTVGAPGLYPMVDSPWGPSQLLGWFSANETVDLTYSFPIGGPATVVTSSTADFRAALSPPPPGKAPSSVTVTATGRTHHTVVRTTFSFAQTVLSAGQSVQSGLWPLSTPALGSSVMVLGSLIIVDRWRMDNGYAVNSIGWQSPNLHGSPADSSTLTMRYDGNLVLTSKAGVVWSSGTAGTGTRNSVSLNARGALVIYTAQGQPVWSSAANGLVYQSSAYSASSRVHSAVYINGLFKLHNPKTGYLDAAGRHVYLQRLLAGHWQTMLERTTNSAGSIAVGFIQTHPYQYRLVALATANASAATSATTTR